MHTSHCMYASLSLSIYIYIYICYYIYKRPCPSFRQLCEGLTVVSPTISSNTPLHFIQTNMRSWHSGDKHLSSPPVSFRRGLFVWTELEKSGRNQMRPY